MYRGLAEPVEETESARNEVDQASSECLGDVRDAFFDGDSCGAKQVFDVRGDTYARVFDELECFVEDALDQRLFNGVEFGAAGLGYVSSDTAGEPLLHQLSR